MNEYEQENYRGKKKVSGALTIKQIILEQVKEIVKIGSREFRGGYNEEAVIVLDGQPQIVKRYIEDGRQTYCNAVLSLNVITSNFYAKSLTDKSKEKEMLIGVNKVQAKIIDRYNKYLDELKEENIDQQAVKYKYQWGNTV